MEATAITASVAAISGYKIHERDDFSLMVKGRSGL